MESKRIRLSNGTQAITRKVNKKSLEIRCRKFKIFPESAPITNPDDEALAFQLSQGTNQTQLFQQFNCLIDEDEKIARELQKQFDEENRKKPATSGVVFSPRAKIKHKYNNMAPHLQSDLCSAEWEALDPNPDIHSLFLQFDQMFFWNSLGIVQLEWSKRMYTCAGICYYQADRNGESCIIRLSEPLLKLRSRGDLVNTLIHEMIHAFLFVTHSDRDRDGHGPRFQAHMHRINQCAKTNITIYHEWHEETEFYKQHVWRCNGVCQNHPPFFGWLRLGV